MKQADFVSAEDRYFFKIASRLNKTLRNGTSTAEHVDKLRILAINTENALLRTRVNALMITALRDVTVRAGGRFSIDSTGIPIVEFGDDDF